MKKPEKPAFSILRVTKTVGHGRHQEITTGETLLETSTIEEALAAVRKMGGRVIVRRLADDVMMATRLKAPDAYVPKKKDSGDPTSGSDWNEWVNT